MCNTLWKMMLLLPMKAGIWRDGARVLRVIVLVFYKLSGPYISSIKTQDVQDLAKCLGCNIELANYILLGLQLGAKTKSKGIRQVVENIEKKAVWLKEAIPVVWWENKFNIQHLRFFSNLDDVSVSHAEVGGERKLDKLRREFL
ncbi:hypothetical protein HAX54_028038 [Datura stramonium]|uniref:Uncharacterized protein n=1 Tax=Datura stramonium TaxID=4076 RepID=A0ABS8S977_DATST|nr:hypothetical protein [Datura stramonium]